MRPGQVMQKAALKLGDLYLDGTKVKKDIKKAIESYEMASEKENAEASFKLGKIYEGNKNLDQAKIYYQKSIGQGDNIPMARVKLGDIYLNSYLSRKSRKF